MSARALLMKVAIVPILFFFFLLLQTLVDRSFARRGSLSALDG